MPDSVTPTYLANTKGMVYFFFAFLHLIADLASKIDSPVKLSFGHKLARSRLHLVEGFIAQDNYG